jgi:drug/metabolite transporter (DMT)-like permease
MSPPSSGSNGQRPPAETSAPDPSTLIAFLVASVIAGANAVAVRIGLQELPVFWGAAFRFIVAAAILLVAALAMRKAFPSGRALVGAALYGLFSVGLIYAFLYYALIEATGGTVMVGVAIMPLITLLLATLQKVEPFTLRGLVGALIACAGIAVVFADQIGVVSVSTLGAILGGAFAGAQGAVVVKSFPRQDPVVLNGIGLAVGGVLLLAISAVAGEAWILPTQRPVQISLVYLILVGSIGFFLLFLFILGRWTASASVYVLLLAPLAAVVLDLLLLGDAPSILLLVGGLMAIAGVYVGVVHQPRAATAGAR